MRLIELASAHTRATVAPEAGGRLVQIEILEGGVWLPLLVAPTKLQSLLDEPLRGGCYPMVPWPGRVDHSRFSWRGDSFELPRNDGPHSIHGSGVYRPWEVREVTATSCRLELDLGSSDGWPFPAVVTQDIAVVDDAIKLQMEVRALDQGEFPAGVGWHPWFRRDVRPGVDPRVRVAADLHYVSRADLVPTGATMVPEGEADLREGPQLGARRLDDFYGGVAEPMTVVWGDLVLTMRSSANMGHAVVYTRSPRGFCVEPQTCVPDAFNLASRGLEGTGLVVVEPGQPLVAETVWTWATGSTGDTDGSRID
jgi:aldose 1-epimerase